MHPEDLVQEVFLNSGADFCSTMSWQCFPDKDMHQGEDAAPLNYGEALIPEVDAIELGKKYSEINGFEGFVVVPGIEKGLIVSMAKSWLWLSRNT